MDPLVAQADAEAYVGATGEAEQAKVASELGAISAELRRRTRRAFEGIPTVYDLVLPVKGAERIVLPHVPVDAIIAIRPVAFDDTEDEVLELREVDDGADTTLAAIAAAGATNLKLTSVDDVAVGDHLAIGSGDTLEVVRAAAVGTAGSGGTGVGVEPALRFAQASAATVREVSGSTRWRLEDAARGLVRLRRSMDYARFTWRVTGEIPADVGQMALDWLKSEWEASVNEPADEPILASQSSEDWSESYVADEQTSIVRRVPPRVARMIGLYFHPSGPVGAV